MRLGYSYWGFLGDTKMDQNGRDVSTPDGNATYSWSIIHEAQKRGWLVYAMQDDRDLPAYRKFGKDIFSSFSQKKRFAAYMDMYTPVFPGQSEFLPELDVLLLEWRFPIPGRNCSQVGEDGSIWFGHDGWDQPDLHRQIQLLEYYKEKKTKIIFWDLDHKLTENDERKWNPDAIFETSHSPLKLFKERTRVEPPCVVADLLEHPTLPADPNRKLVYIGSRYERDDVITEWVKPTSDAYPNHVEFWGNWLKTVDECRKLWPNVSYNERITTRDFRRVYGTAGAVPLLAKRSYLQTGFITPRPWEALMFGSIPIGLASAKGIEQYTVDQAGDGQDMVELAELYAGLSLNHRDLIRKDNVEMLEFMDARHFVDKIQAVL